MLLPVLYTAYLLNLTFLFEDYAATLDEFGWHIRSVKQILLGGLVAE